MKVGQEIESVCGKCGDVWHVVAAMVGAKVVKVVCKRCGGQHRHKPPGGAVAAAKEPREKKPASGKPAKERGARGTGSRSEPAGPQVEPDLKRPVRPYRPADLYQLRDRIEHRTFGSGVIDEIPGPGKIQVWFPGGHKVLVHGVVPPS